MKEVKERFHLKIGRDILVILANAINRHVAFHEHQQRSPYHCFLIHNTTLLESCHLDRSTIVQPSANLNKGHFRLAVQ